MRKKIISVLLIAVFVIGMIPMITTASGTGTAVKGEYTYSLTSDPDTGTVPDGFGTVSNNGRIWTDKSVNVNDDHFNVNLKVLAQEYVSSYSSTITQSIAADVVMVLDFTQSMNSNSVDKDDGTSVTRLEALVDSVNQAIEIITKTNVNNRIVVYSFYGNTTSATVNEIMPLAHYTSTSTSEDTIGKYIVFGGSSSGGGQGGPGGGGNVTVKSSDTLLKDGESFTFSATTGTGTGTQYGIAESLSQFVNTINSETDNSITRKPYVILMTDGEPTSASKNWYSNNTADLKSNTLSNGGGGQGGSSSGDNATIIPALTILTAAVWKDRVRDAYENYNGKDYGVEWFNVGLGVDNDNDATGCLVNPAFLVNVTGSNASGASDAEKVKHYMVNSDFGTSSYTQKDYSVDDGYVYINDGDGYVTFANTYSVLMNAFTTLAEIIKQGSQEYTIPIVYHEGSGETSSDVVFTDVIGEGMYVTDISLTQNGGSPVYGDDSDGDGTYTFRGYSTTVTITEDNNGQQTLVWNLPANEVSMFTFANREDVTNGEYVSAEPTVLTYGVDFTNDIEEGPAYTNAFDSNNVPLTTVTYEIPGDNDYYFDVIKDSEHQFVSSTMKTGLDGYTQKTDNVTSTAPNSHSYTYTAVADGTEASSATVNGTLGNNGKASFLSRKENIEITVEKKWEDKNGAAVTDTTGLPAVTVTLYRKADGSDVEETAQVVQLNNSNDYSETYTVPIRDPNNNRYSYYIKENNCPDGYYIANISSPIRADDGTLTVTNREFPEEGAIAVIKHWQNKIGAEITNTSTLPNVEVNLKRHVEKVTSLMHTVTISATDSTNSYTDTAAVRTFQVPDGTTISFTIRMYCNNSGSATISLKKTVIDDNGQPVVTNSTVNSTQLNNQRTDYSYTDDPFVYGAQVRFSNNRSARESSTTQEFEITSDTTLEYTCSRTFNLNNFPYTDNSGNTIYPYMVRDLTKTESGAPSVITEEYDENYDSVILNNNSSWQKVFDNLTLTETISNSTYTYKYYVEETPIPGYTAYYSSNNDEGITGGVLEITNKSDSAIGPLPETGGRGESQTIRIIGFSAVFLSAALYFTHLAIPYIKKRRRAET